MIDSWWRRTLAIAERGNLTARASALAATATCIGLAWTWVEYPGHARGVVLVVCGAALLALIVHRVRLLTSLLLAVGGGVAVAMTSRELFSFWPAGAGLLFLSLSKPPSRRHHALVQVLFASASAAVGLYWAATTSERDAITALFPVAFAAAAVVLVRTLQPLLTKAIALRAHAESMRQLAVAAEADKRELERRATLARELHDSLGHHVTAMVVQAEAGRVGAADRALESIGDLGRVALAELESVLFELRTGPAMNDSPVDLQRSIDQLAQPLRDCGTKVRVQIETSANSPQLLRAICRIVQEGLTNVMRHASATTVSIEILDDGVDVVVRILDDGVGLPADVVRGSGLAGIVTRAQEQGGRAELIKGHPHGLLIEAHLQRRGS